MPPPSMVNDPAFEGAGRKGGLEIWCVENLHLVPIPRSSHGKFYSGNAYLILNTVVQKNGSTQHDIHYWTGDKAKEEDVILASDKALELDEVLGSCAVQYREIQGQETERFLSYFKPCIIPIEGVFSSDLVNSEGEAYRVSLLTCKGDHVVHVKEVPFSRSSLNHHDIFILDTASKIFLFSGCNSSIQERAKALEVVHYIKESKHSGNCEVATVEDGKFVGDADVGEFWSFFGGYAPIPRDSPSAFQMQNSLHSVKLLRITPQGSLHECEMDLLSREMLHTDKCYVLDCNSEIFVWMGRNTSITERKTSISATEEFLRNEGRSMDTRVTFLTEGTETATFRSHFRNWPEKEEVKLYEEGRGKVAAMFKQNGYDVKELPDDDYDPVINCRGLLKVWRVDSGQIIVLPPSEQSKLFSGDCYVVQYTYPGLERDEILIYAWFGSASLMEDRADAIAQMINLADSFKGSPVLAQVFQGKEPDQFLSISQALIFFKGGQCSRYKKFITENGVQDETYDEKKIALFRIQGRSTRNMQAVQVDEVSSSLNSSYCFILQTGTSVFTWIGNLSSTRDHELLDRMLELINPTWQHASLREGSEPEAFWEALGGKTEYPREKRTEQYMEDPHLFSLSVNKGDLKVKEIYNYTQGDLTTEDILILDCQRELHVWVGCHSNITSKEDAFTFGQKFIEMDILDEGLSPQTPIHVITEGNEPPFFTCFFSWDPSKANLHGNSFERKLAALKGRTQHLQAPVRNSWKTNSRGGTPDGLRGTSVNSYGCGRSASPSTWVRGSNNHDSDNQLGSSPSSLVKKLFSDSPQNGSSDSSAQVLKPSPDNDNISHVNGAKPNMNMPIYSFERLKVTSEDPVTDIDVTKREAYLCEEEFEEKFKMTKNAFYQLPKWRQNKLKMSLNLF